MIKKYFFTVFLSFILFFNPYKVHSSTNIPDFYGGQIISLKEYQQYVDYCFYSYWHILEDSYNFSSPSQVDYNYRLYGIEDGVMVLGHDEHILRCYTEQAARTQFSGSDFDSVRKSNYTLKRGFSDRCLGMDWFQGYWSIYSCIPETGEWIKISESVGGSADLNSGTYDCYDSHSDKFYGGSSYLNLVISKKKLFGVSYEDSYYYRTFSCVQGEEKIANNPNLVQLRAGLTTSRVSSDIVSNGTTGTSTGGTGTGTGTSSTDATNQKIDQIKTQLTQIQDSNATFKSESLGKLSEVKSEILLQNQNIAVSQNVLMEKLTSLEQKNQLLKEDLNSKIESANNNLKTSISESLDVQTNSLKTKIDESNLDLTKKIENNQLEINDLSDLVRGYNSDNLSGRNEILGRLSGLENKINGLDSTLADIANNQNSGSGNGTDLSGVNTGLSNIDNTLKFSLQNDEGKPFLKSISDNLSNMFKPLSGDDYSNSQSDINSAISSSLNDSFSKYSDVLGFGSNYGTAPSNITVNLMGQTYTLLNFSVLDNYIYIIRSLFLSLAYLYGFMNLIRGNK